MPERATRLFGIQRLWYDKKQQVRQHKMKIRMRCWRALLPLCVAMLCGCARIDVSSETGASGSWFVFGFPRIVIDGDESVVAMRVKSLGYAGLLNGHNLGYLSGELVVSPPGQSNIIVFPDGSGDTKESVTVVEGLLDN